MNAPVVQMITKQILKSPSSGWILSDNGIALENVPQSVGAKNWSGVFRIPDHTLWRSLDPEGRFSAIWNRYAHVQYFFRPESPFKVELGGSVDLVIVNLNLEAIERLKKLGVRMILTNCNSSWATFKDAVFSQKAGDQCVFSLKD